MSETLSLNTAVTALEHCPWGVLLFNDTGELAWVNRHGTAMLADAGVAPQGLRSADLMGRLITGPEGLTMLGDSDRAVGLSQQSLVCDGKSYTAWYLSDLGQLRQERLERLQLQEKLQQEAMYNPATGLLTRTSLLKNLDLLITRSRRYENPLSLIMLRVAEFSAKAEREQVLLAVGHALRDQMRWVDMISRADDDNFIIVMPETVAELVPPLVRKIRERLESLSVPYGNGKPCIVRAEFGVASWCKGDDSQLLLRRLEDSLGTGDSLRQQAPMV